MNNKAKTGCVAALIVAVPALAVVALGYMAWRSGKIPTKLSLSSGPSTCPEFAEHLKAKGMQIRWTTCKHSPHPAIFVVRNEKPTGRKYIGAGGGPAGSTGDLTTDAELEFYLNEVVDQIW